MNRKFAWLDPYVQVKSLDLFFGVVPSITNVAQWNNETWECGEQHNECHVHGKLIKTNAISITIQHFTNSTLLIPHGLHSAFAEKLK